MTHIRPDGKKVAVISKDNKVEMGCLKLNSFSEWTVQDLTAIFGDAAQIKVIETAETKIEQTAAEEKN